MAFLPTTREEMLEQGFESVDFVYVSGDAYVDHPSFGCAIITRTLQAYGYSCAILPQPDWHNDEEFTQFGEPRLGFLVSAGNIDSMVNHYSVNKRRRDKDSYSDEGVMGKRPDRPTIVYTQILKRLFPHKPVLIGGIEASLRRLSHYDYWDDKVRRSILIDSQADLLMYGMGENTIIEVADALNSGLRAEDLCYIRGTCWKTKALEYLSDYVLLPSYEEVCADKHTYAKSFHIQHENIDAIAASVLVEPYDGWYVVQNQPPLPLTQEEMEAEIRDCGLYHAKAKNLLGMCHMLTERFNSVIPDDIKTLMELPGVGQKTANVIASIIYNIPALAVDTHVFRVSHRLGLAKGKDPLATEKELEKIIPREKWSDAHHWFIWHGRKICKARKPLCRGCVVVEECPFKEKNFE